MATRLRQKDSLSPLVLSASIHVVLGNPNGIISTAHSADIHHPDDDAPRLTPAEAAGGLELPWADGGEAVAAERPAIAGPSGHCSGRGRLSHLQRSAQASWIAISPPRRSGDRKRRRFHGRRRPPSATCMTSAAVGRHRLGHHGVPAAVTVEDASDRAETHGTPTAVM